MDEKWIKIVHVLYQENRPMSLDELAFCLDCTYNTIKSSLSRNNELAQQCGIKIIESNKITLEIIDENKFYFFLSSSNLNDDKVNEILDHLLFANDYLRIEELAEKMYVSRATIDRLIPEIKLIVKKFELEFISRPKFGIRIQGSEINKRLCLARHKTFNSINVLSDELASHVIMRIQLLIAQALESNDIQMNDINFYNLVQHCIIMIQRIRSDNAILDTQNIQFEDNVKKELLVSNQICDDFEHHFRILINEAERKCIAMHLLGKRIFSNGEVINVDILNCIHNIFDEIKRVKGSDFHQDVELMTTLALHMQPLISRLKFGLIQQNPIADKIKREMPRGFEFALCASEIIYMKYKFRMNESELAYLAIHFSLALERSKEVKPKKKILVVCSTGNGTAKFVQYRLMEYFNYRKEDIILTNLFQINDYDFNEIECILTTIPLSKQYPVNVIFIDLVLNDVDFKKIDSYFNKLGNLDLLSEVVKEELIFADYDFTNRKQILKYICNQVDQMYHLDLYKQVMKREELSSTEVGNQLAYPHPYEYNGDKLIVCAMSLNKPVKWKFGNVKMVLFLCYPPSDTDVEKISQSFTELALNMNVVKELMKDLTAENLIKALMGKLI